MTYTKKDYILVASVIHRAGFIEDKNQVKNQAKKDALRLVAYNFIGEFRNNNPKFDEDKFLSACGISKY